MKHLYSASALLFLALLFLALTLLSGALLKGARLDLTEQQLYTLSPGTINLLEAIEEPITLEFYFSEGSSSDFPMVRDYARRVQELLDEMETRSGGQLRVRRIDPRPFSEEEDQAARYGLEEIPVGTAGDSLYLGLVGTNMIDGLEVLPFLSPSREATLEYELARMIYVLSRPERPRVGLLSGLPMDERLDMQTGRSQPAWAVREQIDEMFEVETIEPVADGLPQDLDVLVIVHPPELDEELMRDIDRFVLGGGRLLAFVDPYSESDPDPEQGDPAAAMAMERSSSLYPLFEAWGLEFDPDRFVADLGQALQVSMQSGQRPVRHPGIIGVTREHMSSEDVVTGELDAINLASPGALSLAEDSALTLKPLMQSSPNAGLIDAERLRFLEDPGSLMAEVAATGEQYVLAARLSGEVDSAFDEHRNSPGQLEAIVVADTDLLADRYWVQRQQFFGTSILEPFAGNGDFVINAIDNLMGSADLISVRSRATAARPFTLVEALRREAEQNLLATEQRLEAELAETEGRLTELQQARADTDLSVLTSEQEAELDRFMEQRIEIRQQLRQVRRDLDRDIEALGARVKVLNIGLMPALVTVLALVLAWRRRRRAKRSAEAQQ
ncbi:Gldg family protein [Wenzhouxiangella sp. AB-CW3]|uniref:GldG family protein n=1 Tax=Wenzhouxiangella sp. AB-CW3 TaxID=2771012 RepID=UPI00168B0BFB|nr:Gldg family protein [Wenzhouxiangella sp. AB-CW3]QOC21310.1 Gldg family protein [Wenzhouxiangella sp. AB-CW3]